MAKYNKEIVEKCAAWVCENGLMEYGGAKLKEFCECFCIDQRTYYNWLKKSDFSNAIKKAKEDYKNSIGREVFISLAKAAKGYEYDQLTTEYVDVNGKPKIKKQTKVSKHVEPNVTAAIFLLKNLDPEHFKDVQRQEITGKDGAQFTGFNFLPYTLEAEKLRDKE